MTRRYTTSRRRPAVNKKKKNWLTRVGRIVVLVWSAILVGLFVFANGDVRFQPSDDEGKDGITQVEVSSTVSSEFLPDEIGLKHFEQIKGENLQNGKGLAFVNATTCVVDNKGRLLKTEAGIGIEDLPIITCADVKVDRKKMRVLTPEVLECLEFLDLLKKKSLPYYYYLSQIHIDSSVGAILYCEGQNVPTILGSGHPKRKVAYLATIIKYIGNEEELSKIKYLDLRLDGQVIAKLYEQ